jgi:hypothetical protein
VLLEPLFLLTYYGGFSYADAYRLPTAYKRWWIARIARELSRTSEEGQTATRGLHGNTPDVRAAQGRQRTHVPTRLQRFN